MAIRIKTEKFWSNGIKYRRIMRIKALRVSELPGEYIDTGEPHCYTIGTNATDLNICNANGVISHAMYAGKVYTEVEFGKWVAVLNRCGDRLQKINKKLRDEWSGTETITI